MNWDRTLSLIPDGVQTLSKMPSKYVEGVYPTYIDRGDGSKVYAGDNEYIDYTCGLGAIILGYGIQEINRAVFTQSQNGTLFGLPHEKEAELAEKLKDHFPIEKMRFLKTGSEATSAAVKIARAHTKKQTILCCGYHGWHEWYNQTTPKNAGCARSSVHSFKYNNIGSLRALFKKHTDVAAVIMEPYVYELPNDNFLKAVQDECKENNALLIFDEVVTGFRTEKWCAANYYDVKPDLMCLGKAMGNGYPISVVGGKAEIMDVLMGDCFVSSTFGGDLIGITAALETIKIIEEKGVIRRINEQGNKLKIAFNHIASTEGVKAECIGQGCRTRFNFKSALDRTVFWQECLKKGVFFGHAQFTSFSHDLGDCDKTEAAMRHAFRMMRKYKNNMKDLLEGQVAQETLRLDR